MPFYFNFQSGESVWEKPQDFDENIHDFGEFNQFQHHKSNSKKKGNKARNSQGFTKNNNAQIKTYNPKQNNSGQGLKFALLKPQSLLYILDLHTQFKNLEFNSFLHVNRIK